MSDVNWNEVADILKATIHHYPMVEPTKEQRAVLEAARASNREHYCMVYDKVGLKAFLKASNQPEDENRLQELLPHVVCLACGNTYRKDTEHKCSRGAG